MHKRKLRAAMIAFGDTRNSLAEYLGIAPTTLSYKMNESHGRCFDKSEIDRIVSRYSLSGDDIQSIFFGELVS